MGGIKLIKGKNKAYESLRLHQRSTNHSELLVAHRGYSSLEPDNSYEGVERSLESECADIIEIDVRMTKDNQLILHHDSTIDYRGRYTSIDTINLDTLDESKVKSRNPSFNFENMLYDDFLFHLERFHNKDKEDQEIIKFEDFINWYPFDKKLIIDVKTDKVDPKFIEELNRILNEHKGDVYIQSADISFLTEMKKRYKDYSYLFIVNSIDDIPHMDDDMDGFTIKSSFLSRAIIKDDKMYTIYTINSRNKYLSIISNPNYREDMYLVTDDPDYLCEVGEEHKKKELK